MSASEIQITARPSVDTTQCTFEVDRPVAGLSRYFGSAEEAGAVPVVRQIFELKSEDGIGIAGVLIDRRLVTVTAAAVYVPDWRPLARAVGALLRAALESGAPLLDEKVLADLPPEEEIRAQVQALFDEEINPAVASHGGFLELVEVRHNELYLRMGGGCQGCASAEATLRQGVERAIRQRVPAVGAIHDATDHSAGTAPYFSRS